MAIFVTIATVESEMLMQDFNIWAIVLTSTKKLVNIIFLA